MGIATHIRQCVAKQPTQTRNGHMHVNSQVESSTPEYVSAMEAARLFGVHPDVIRNSPEVKQHRVTVMRPQSVYPIDKIKRFIATQPASSSPAEVSPENEASPHSGDTSEDSGAGPSHEPRLPERYSRESVSAYVSRVHREKPHTLYSLKAWSGRTGISVKELERAIEFRALSSEEKRDGRNHGLKLVSGAALTAYASIVEAVSCKQVPPPSWWADVVRTGPRSRR